MKDLQKFRGLNSKQTNLTADRQIKGISIFAKSTKSLFSLSSGW